jgi:hypothetical protein
MNQSEKSDAYKLAEFIDKGDNKYTHSINLFVNGIIANEVIQGRPDSAAIIGFLYLTVNAVGAAMSIDKIRRDEYAGIEDDAKGKERRKWLKFAGVAVAPFLTAVAIENPEMIQGAMLTAVDQIADNLPEILDTLKNALVVGAGVGTAGYVGKKAGEKALSLITKAADGLMNAVNSVKEFKDSIEFQSPMIRVEVKVPNQSERHAKRNRSNDHYNPEDDDGRLNM